MIGRIRGILIETSPPYLLVEAAGVGYEIEAPLSTFQNLPEVGQEVCLHTHFLVKEDLQALFGFAREDERALFRALLKISGVGAKLALTILSGYPAAQFSVIVASGDVDALVRLPGIGKKTAQRLIMEMKDKLPEQAGQSGAITVASTASAMPGDARSDAVAGLTALGYKPHEAATMVRNVEGDELDVEEILRRALSGLAL